jgi:AbrB family looped-hinge helix DNA binding protein
MQQAKVTYKGQITIPKAVRDALNIEEGDSVTLRVEGEHAILRPVKKKALLEFFGVFPATKPYPGTASLRKRVGKKLGENLCARMKS